MKISVITVALNEAQTIQKTLNSVAMQSYSDIEHIIIDGGSTDGTFELAMEYAQKANYMVRVLRQTFPGRIYGALNEGISMATGDVIATLHANDYYPTRDELNIVAENFRDSEASIIYGNIYYVTESGKQGRKYSAKKFRRESLLDGFMPPHPAMFMKKDLFDKYGLYSTKFTIAGDYELCIRVILKSTEKLKYTDRNFVAMSIGGISGKPVNRIWRTNKEKLEVLKLNEIDINPLRLMKRYFYL